MEMGHNKLLDKLRPKILVKIESLRNQYGPEIASHGVQYFWNKENDVLVVNCSKYNINWYALFFPKMVQIYEEAPAYIKPFLSVYRDQFISVIHNELQEIIILDNSEKEVE